MVKAYLRYEHTSTLGVISSPDSNACFDASGASLITAALDEVAVWSAKTGRRERTLAEGAVRAQVTALCRSPDGAHVAAGYFDGVVRVWSLQGGTAVAFSGHKKAVSSLAYDATGGLLASGGRDTDVVVWDVVAEEGAARLKGHKDEVTDLVFLPGRRILSSSKDTHCKLWELGTQTCVQTLVGHRSQVWSVAADPSGSTIVTGSQDHELRVWGWGATPEGAGTEEGAEEDDGGVNVDHRELVLRGTLPRASRSRVVTVRFGAEGAVLGVQSADRNVELWRVRTAEERTKKLKRKQKRKKEKSKQTAEKKSAAAAAAAETDGAEEDAAAAAEEEEQPAAAAGAAESTPEDEFAPLLTVRASAKVRSFAFSPVAPRQRLRTTEEVAGSGKRVRMLCSLSNNSVEVFDVDVGAKEQSKYGAIESCGHRDAIRAVGLSHADDLLFSVSTGSLKVWSLRTHECVRTMACGYGLCGSFLPGDRQIVVGCKDGGLELFDLHSASMLQRYEEHSGAIWSLDVKSDGTSVCTGSADQDIKFWDIELITKYVDSAAVKTLDLECTRTLTMQEDVLCVKFSPDGRFVACSLLDCTVKVFYEDSLKFFLSLYGHRLPVMCMSISFDGRLIVTGSADKNIKIWGMDFGDCHKSMFAHGDSVMALQFVPRTHYFFSAGKDKMLKYWDADKFEQVLALPGHHNEIWCMAISKQGTFVVSGSHDRSLRVWDQTDEQLFLEEEKENEMEAIFEANLDDEARPDGMVAGPLAVTRTLENLKAGERLAESLELAEEWRDNHEKYEAELAACGEGDDPEAIATPPVNPLLLGRDGATYLLRAMRKVPMADLEEALMVLPFNSVLSLLRFMEGWLRAGQATELVCRALFFIVKIYHNQLISTRMKSQLGLLESLRDETRRRLQEEKDTIGLNLAAVKHIQADMEHSGMRFFEMATDDAVREKQHTAGALEASINPQPSAKRRKAEERYKKEQSAVADKAESSGVSVAQDSSMRISMRGKSKRR